MVRETTTQAIYGLQIRLANCPLYPQSSCSHGPQTTSNACATVALLNIIMNAEGVELGDKLREFKEETKDMCTSLRGHYLSSSTFIRTTHNSFTRRMDHLNADLLLENQASEASSKNKKRTVSSKSSRKKKKKANVDSEYGFHFVAYVPAHGYVWELDGLMNKPHKIGISFALYHTILAKVLMPIG